jgi:hypothetical protein
MENCKFIVFLSNIPENKFTEWELKGIFKFDSFKPLGQTAGLIGYNDNNQYQSVINQGIFV